MSNLNASLRQMPVSAECQSRLTASLSPPMTSYSYTPRQSSRSARYGKSVITHTDTFHFSPQETRPNDHYSAAAGAQAGVRTGVTGLVGTSPGSQHHINPLHPLDLSRNHPNISWPLPALGHCERHYILVPEVIFH